MHIRANTVHDDIVSALNAKIYETCESFKVVLGERQEEIKNRIVPNAGSAYDSFIRSIRKRALAQYDGIKAWLGTQVLGSLIQQSQTSGFYKLQELNEMITEAEAEKKKVSSERERILKNEKALTGFEKYKLYGHQELKQSIRPAENSSDESSHVSVEEDSSDIEAVYKKYNLKIKQSLLIGLVVTAACAAMDFSIIYQFYLSANTSLTLAIINALISSVMLDAPPYVLGYVWTKSDDDKGLFELQGNGNTPEAMRKNRGNKILIFVLLAVIVLVFLAYLFVRILAFWGGGDFNLAFRAMVEQGVAENVEFTGADLISITVPVVSSVIALAVGKTLYPMRSDYIKESIIVINNGISKRIKACSDKIVDYERQIVDLKEQIEILQREIWTFYKGMEPFPQNVDTFRTEISLAFQRLDLGRYKQTYSDCCVLLRERAAASLRVVNEQFAQYAADQTRIRDMAVSQDEAFHLDDFWVFPSGGGVQHQMTQMHLGAIDDMTKKLLEHIE